MNVLRLTTLCFIAASAFAPSADAESLRCPGGIVSEGDSRLSVVYKCGQPRLTDSFCAPVFYSGTLNRVPEALAALHVPCQHIDEWLYERGSGSLVASVRLRAGKVQSIVYGHAPQ